MELINLADTSNIKKDIANTYDESLGYQTSFGIYKLSIIAERISKISNMNIDQTVLEIGSGTGELAIRYVKKSKYVLSTDINEYMVKISKGKAKNLQIQNLEFSVTDGLRLPFYDNTFDIVIERNNPLVYKQKNLDDNTARMFLKEMTRVSKKKVVLIHEHKSPLLLFNHIDISDHYFVEKELKRLLESICLNNVKTMYVTHSIPLIFNLFGGMNQLEKIIQIMPYFKKMAGGIIICGTK